VYDEAVHHHKYGTTRRQHTWVKAHVMCGVKTNIVTAIEILDRDASDIRQLPALVARTARNFALGDVTADRAYGSVKNTETICQPPFEVSWAKPANASAWPAPARGGSLRARPRAPA